MLIPLRPAAYRHASQMAFILGLCILSLAALLLAGGSGGAALIEPNRDNSAEITDLNPCVNAEFDGHSAIACLPLTQQLEKIGPRPVDIQFLAHGPALRPIVPPPETALHI